MNELDDMLRYGLDRISDQARATDLDRRAAAAARTIRRRRIALRAAAGLIGLGLAASVVTALQSESDDTSRMVDTTPTPTPSPDPDAPWLSTEDVAALTGIHQWYDVSDQPSRVSRTGLQGCGTSISTEVERQWLASLVDSASFLGPDRVGADDRVVYRVYRFYTPMAASNDYQHHAGPMEPCSPDEGQGLGGHSSDPGSTDVRWREALAAYTPTDSASSLVVLRDRYVAILSWTTGGDRRPRFGSHDEERAAVFVDELVAGTLRHERDNPLPAWALSWTGELGPEGLGGVRLGMTEAEAMATGELARETSGETCNTAVFRADYGAGVLISDRHGVVAIDAGGSRMFTAEGLRPQTTFAEFKRIYPNFREERPYLFSAPVPGNPDARYVVNVGRLEGQPLTIGGIEMWSSVRDKCLDSRLQ